MTSDLATAERLISCVVLSPSGCWEWRGERNRDGYGVFKDFPTPGKRRRRGAHRVSFETFIGPLSACACHHCDNPPCIHPLHLFDGTVGDNSRDKIAKGRQASGPAPSAIRIRHALRGEAGTNTRLTAAQVLEIRTVKAAARGRYWGARELAQRFGIQLRHLMAICSGRVWREGPWPGVGELAHHTCQSTLLRTDRSDDEEESETP